MKIETKSRGRFIVIEGCEGAGKSTQIKNLEREFPEAVFFREPGGTEFAEDMRSIVLTSRHCKDLSAYEQMCLVFAGRSQNIRKIVEPALRAGKMVIVDRYDASTFAYQLFGMNEGGEDQGPLFGLFNTQRLNMGPLDCLPDLYLILDVSPEEGMRRVAERKAAKGDSNHFDERGPEFHARVRDGYRRFAEMHGSKVRMIDAHPSKEIVWDSVLDAINPKK